MLQSTPGRKEIRPEGFPAATSTYIDADIRDR